MSQDNKNLENEDTQVVEDTHVVEDTQVIDKNNTPNEDTQFVNQPPMPVNKKAAPFAGVVPPVPADDPVEPAPKRSKKWIAWLLGGIVLVGGGGAAAYYFMNKTDDPNANPDHSDDDQFENFGDLARDLGQIGFASASESYSDDYYADSTKVAYEAPAYYGAETVDSVATEAPAAEAAYYDYYNDMK